MATSGQDLQLGEAFEGDFGHQSTETVEGSSGN
jgi:hypothetical protein